MPAFLLSLLLTLSPMLPGRGVVVAKGQRFQAEVAVTPQEQMRGLMYRDSLAKDAAMIFIYDEDGRRPIWMKNCLISLDVVWIKADGTIVEMADNVPPLSPMFTAPDEQAPTYGGKVVSRHFVEFPVGTIKHLGLKVGDKLGWNLKLGDGTPVVGGLPVLKSK